MKGEALESNKTQVVSFHAESENKDSQEQETSRSEKIEIIMCMDSNGKHLIRRKLWDLDGTEHRKCYTLEEVENVANNTENYKNLKYFLISVGCNDLDRNDPETVFDKIRGIVSRLLEIHPHMKIIIGEITPRMDEKDDLVVTANELINRFAESNEKLYVIKNSNLRDPYFFYRGDSKHIRKKCIGRFAANIKYTLRVAYGRKKFIPSVQSGSTDMTHQQQRFQHQPLLHQQHQQQQQQQQLQQQSQHQILNQLQLQQFLHFLLQQNSNHLEYSNKSSQNVTANRFTDSSALDIHRGLGVT